MANITNVAVATAVINEAMTHKVHNGGMPESEADKISVANSLLALAEQAKAAGVGAAAVTAVIAAAQQEPTATDVPANPFGAAPAPTPTPAPAPPAPVAPPAPAPAPTPATPGNVTIDTAIPGYDDLGVPDVLEAMAKLNQAGVDFVKAYEKENGERARIMNYQPEGAAPAVVQPAAPAPSSSPETAPAAGPNFASADPSQYEQVEPWDGYGSAKISDIMKVVTARFEQDAQAARPVLAHVWAYESATKERSSLLKKLKELAENGVPVPAPAAAAPAPVATEAQADVVAESPFAQTPATPPVENVFANQQASVPAADPFPQADAQPVQGATQKAQAFIAQEGLPIPASVSDVPAIPEDGTKLSDVEVRKYQTQFNACQARAQYLLSIAEGHEADAKIVADHLANEWISAQSWPAKVTVTEQTNKAGSDQGVAQARHAVAEFREQARQLRALRDVYQATCDRLSREQTGRANEHSTVR